MNPSINKPKKLTPQWIPLSHEMSCAYGMVIVGYRFDATQYISIREPLIQ